MELLADRGAILSYHDPYVPALPELGLQSTSLDGAGTADAVILVTAHPGVDHQALVDSAQLFVDLRGTTRTMRAPTALRL
jgi:UDP-N-acetyl-D-glucosamine dehydrogenase